MLDDHDLPRVPRVPHVPHEQQRERAPREQLRARVTEHLRTIDALGLHANRSVSLGGTVFPAWLLDDPLAQVTARRWLLLPDGDVWCEAAYAVRPSAHTDGTDFGWLTRPNRGLESVLDLALHEARHGGAGLLVDRRGVPAPYPVGDRRRGAERRSGIDRRSLHEPPPGVERRRVERRVLRDRRLHT
jgi:hypothetical protein